METQIAQYTRTYYTAHITHYKQTTTPYTLNKNKLHTTHIAHKTLLRHYTLYNLYNTLHTRHFQLHTTQINVCV